MKNIVKILIVIIILVFSTFISFIGFPLETSITRPTGGMMIENGKRILWDGQQTIVQWPNIIINTLFYALVISVFVLAVWKVMNRKVNKNNSPTKKIL